MVRVDDDVRTHLPDPLGLNAVGVGEVVVECELRPPAAQRGQALLVIALDDIDCELRVPLVEPADELGKDEGGQRLEAGQDDRAADFLLPGLDRLDRVGDEPEDLPGLVKQSFAGRGEDESLGVLADEERSAERLLQLIDRRGHRRLRNVQLLTRRRHVQSLRALREVRELGERDRESVDHGDLFVLEIYLSDGASR